MFRLAGRGSKEAYKQLAVDDEGCVEEEMPQKTVSLRVISAYRHMGGHINSRGDMVPEAKARSGAATGVINPVKKRVFANATIDREVRLTLAKSLSFSRLLYNAGTWDELSVNAMRCIRRSYMQTYRTVARMHNSQEELAHTSDLQVLQAINEPQVEVVLVTHRLRYLVRLIVHGPAALIRVIFSQHANKRSWVNRVIRDLAFFHTHTDTHKDMPSPIAQPETWFNEIHSNPKTYKSAFVRFQKQWNGKECVADEIPGGIIAEPTVFACSSCTAHFDTEQKLKSHMFRKHTYRNPIHFRLATTMCLCCSNGFHTRHRLYRHVSRRLEKNKCAKFYAERVECSEEHDVTWLEQAEKLARSAKVSSRLLKPPPVPAAY